MIFTINKSKIRNTDFEFDPDNATTLTKTDSTNILDIHFQQQLNWAVIRYSFCTTKNANNCSFQHKKTSL